MDSRILDLQRQVLAGVTAEPLYIPAQGKRTTLPDEEPFDLLEAVKQFFVFKTKSAIANENKDEKASEIKF